MVNPTPETVAVPELAARLGVHEATLYRMVQRGDLRAIRLRRRVLIPREVADRLLAGDGDRAGS